MAIIIFPTVKEDGYGDISFMVQIANTLSEENNTAEPVVIVSEYKDIIKNNYTLREGITVFSIEEFKEQQAELVPSLIIEGPTYDKGRQMRAHPTVPILFLREYSTNEWINDTNSELMLSIAKLKGYHAVNLSSGFREARVRRYEKEHGILVLREYTQLFDRIQTRHDTRDSLWSLVDPNLSQIITHEPYSDYSSKHKLYFSIQSP